MRWQTIDFNELIRLTSLADFLSGTPTIFVKAMVKPLIPLYNQTLYKMQHNSQVIYLEKMLNEYFEVATYDPNSHVATRKVFIANAPRAPKTYIFQPEENRPVYLGTEYLDRETTRTHQFIVKIPVAFQYDEILLREQIDFYKLASKEYIIETY